MIFYEQTKDIMYQEDEENKFLLFNPKTSSVHVLTKLGFKIWEICKNRMSTNEIINQLKNENILNKNLNHSEYQKVLEDFIQELVKRGLLITTDSCSNEK